MKVEFYKHDSYLEMRKKFTGAWTNLRLKIHHLSEKFWRGENDEIENDFRFFPAASENEPLLTLNGEMTKAAARGLFAEHYGRKWIVGYNIEAFIYGNFADNVVYPPETDSLDECSQSFCLPLNKYVYTEFKRRFRARWTNLSVEIYPSELPELKNFQAAKTLTKNSNNEDTF